MNRLTQKNSLGCIYFQVVVGMRNEISECFDMRNIDFLKKWIVVVNILNGFLRNFIQFFHRAVLNLTKKHELNGISWLDTSKLC